MDCPVCGGGMYDQSKSKFTQKPGSPDFKCKDKACKYALNRETGEYEESEYTTGVWLPKAKVVVKTPVKAVSAPNKPTVAHTNDSYKTMVLSYAKDLTVALIAKGEVKEPFKTVADGYKVLLMAYHYPFGKPKPVVETPEVDLNEPPVGDEPPF
jgi:hypothetical protein